MSKHDLMPQAAACGRKTADSRADHLRKEVHWKPEAALYLIGLSERC